MRWRSTSPALAAGPLQATVNDVKYGSDQQSFEAEGFAALAIHSLRAAYGNYLHCPKDTLETVDASTLAIVADAVAEGIVLGLPKGGAGGQRSLPERLRCDVLLDLARHGI